MKNKKPVNQSELIYKEMVQIEKNIRKIKDSALLLEQQRFEENNGCKTCRGRGWIVIWDTLDSMTGCYHESATCDVKTCTPDSRMKSGLMPKNNKYDKFHTGSVWSPFFTDSENSSLLKLNTQHNTLRSEYSCEKNKWENISKGKLVKIIKKGRGRNSHEIGLIGVVQSTFTNSWGTEKALLLDEKGDKHWVTIRQIEIIDPNPSEKWLVLKDPTQEYFPLIGVIIVKARSGKSSLVRFTTGVEAWMPHSYCQELVRKRKGETLSMNVPAWLVKKNNIIK